MRMAGPRAKFFSVHLSPSVNFFIPYMSLREGKFPVLAFVLMVLDVPVL